MLKTLAVLVLGTLLGAGVVLAVLQTRPPPRVEERDVPIVIEKIREVARLESLTVLTFKKISFEPEPTPADSTVGEIANWASKTVYPRRGRLILFADVHMGLDLQKLDSNAIRSKGKKLQMVLPPIITHVELRPGDTEVVESNLKAEQLAQMMEHGRRQMEVEVQRDPVLKARAEQSAERALRAFLLSSGFESVEFVPVLPPLPGNG